MTNVGLLDLPPPSVKDALADNAIRFRPDTPIHANDEDRYLGGTLLRTYP